MGRIEDKFNELRIAGKKSLITFITAGDPDIETTVRLVQEMEKNGADIIELGIPYSDPIAEGPVIQAANGRALSKGLKIRDVMSAVRKIRESVKVPLLYLLYFNSILQYGPDRFFRECTEAGIDGLIIPDLPFEEKGELDEFSEKYGIVMITLVSPISDERITRIAKNAKGFLYCVSSLGVTGVRKDFDTDFKEFFAMIDRTTNIPKAIGFGISTPEHILALRGYCDGLIVGSAMVRRVEAAATPDEVTANVAGYTSELRRALDS